MNTFSSLVKTAARLGRIWVSLAAAVAVVAGLNWTAHKHNHRWDLTAKQTHSLGAKALQIISGLQAPVKVTALVPGVAPEAMADLFEEFERASGGKLSAEIIDPVQNLGYASQFGNKIDTSERRVIVTAGKSHEELNCTEKPIDESRLAAALYRVTTESGKVYFLGGHNEYDWKSQEPDGLGKVAKALEDLNLKCAGIELSTAGKIPEDCQVLVMAGSRTAPTPDENKEIKRYLHDGGHALFLVESAIRTPSGTFTDAEARMNPTWNDVLKDWGVTVGDDVVVDLSNHLGADIGCPATSKYPAHDKIVKGLGVTFLIRPRSITFSKPADRKMLYAPLVETAGADSSWAESDKTLYIKFTPGEDAAGPVTMASVLIQDPTTWKDGKSTKLVVIGDADFVTNQYTNKYSNLDLVVNSIAWLSQREALASDEKAGSPEARLEMTSRDLKMAIAGLAMVPAMTVLFGVLIWWKRKNHR